MYIFYTSLFVMTLFVDIVFDKQPSGPDMLNNSSVLNVQMEKKETKKKGNF